MTGAGELGWRLFAARNLVLGLKALRGDEAARQLFLPIQAVDQLVFAHAGRGGTVPRRAARLAAGISGVIVAIDLARRIQRNPSG